jgi:hypothetical protein
MAPETCPLEGRSADAPNGSVPAFIDPLGFPAVDEPWASMKVEELTTESVLSYLCTHGEGATVEE